MSRNVELRIEQMIRDDKIYPCLLQCIDYHFVCVLGLMYGFLYFGTLDIIEHGHEHLVECLLIGHLCD